MFIQSGERVIILTTMNKSRRFFNKLSISVIIFLLLFLVGLGGCIFVSGNLYRTWRKEILNDSSVRLLKEHSEAIANRIHATEFTRKPDDDSVISELCDLALLFGGRAVVCNDELRVVYDTAQTDTGRYLLIDDAIRAIRGDTIHTVFEEAENGMLLIPIPGMERNASEGVLWEEKHFGIRKTHGICRGAAETDEDRAADWGSCKRAFRRRKKTSLCGTGSCGKTGGHFCG